MPAKTLVGTLSDPFSSVCSFTTFAQTTCTASVEVTVTETAVCFGKRSRTILSTWSEADVFGVTRTLGVSAPQPLGNSSMAITQAALHAEKRRDIGGT